MPVTTNYVAGEQLTAADLNADFAECASVGSVNTFGADQTFDGAINQTASAGTNNETPLLNAADVFSDFIASGMQWTLPSPASLTSSMNAGVSYLNGQRTIVPAISSNTFPASSDTYVSFNNSGNANYASVANGATAPTAPSGYVQTAKVVTSPIISPTPTLSASTAAGTLVAGTYEYQLVAYDATGYGLPSTAVSITTTATGEVILTWVNPLNETSMSIYGRVAGSIGLLASGVTGTTWTDTGANSVGAAPPTSATSNAIQTISRTIALFPINREMPVITPEMFGASGLGYPYEDQNAINNALNYAASIGGASVLCAKTYYCNDNVTVPANCALKGIYGPRPSPSGSNNDNYPSEIVFASNYGVIQDYSSVVSGLILMSLAAQQAPNGTPMFSSGDGVYGSGDIDTSCTDCGIFGFSVAVNFVNNPGRATVDGIFFDCVSGVIISGAEDICEVRNCHGWPQLGSGSILRAGVGYSIIGGSSSWHRVIDCFCFGYQTGYNIDSSGNNSIINCGVDGNFTGAAGNGVGLIIQGTYEGTNNIRNFQSTSNQPIVINISGDSATQPCAVISGLQVWGPNGGGIFTIQEGNLYVENFTLPTGRSDFGSVASGSNLFLEGPAAFAFSSNAASNVIINSIIKNGTFYNSINIKTLGTSQMLALSDTTTGQASPNKFIRSANGELEVVNSDFTSIILQLQDTGNLIIPGISSSGVFNSGNALSVNAPTSGTVNLYMPQQGNGKEVILTFNAYENDTTTAQTINFPVAFSVTPLILGNNTGLTLTASTTGITITAPDSTTTYSGTVAIMGN